MKKQKVFGMLVVGILFLFLIGCSETESSNDANSQTGERENADSSNESSETVTLNFFDWFDEENYMEDVIAKFEEANPDIKINATFVPTNEYEQKLLVNMSSGEGLDVFAVANVGGMSNYQSKGQLLDISDLIDRNELENLSPLIEQLEIEDGLYSLPYRSGAWALYYNKDIFDEAGVDYPDETWTWETYEEKAKELTMKGENGQIWGSLNYQPSSTWWRVPANTAGINNPNNPEDLAGFKEAAKLNYELSYEDKAQEPYSDLVGEAGKDYTGRFLQGNHAMLFNGEWLVEMLNSAMEDGSGEINYDVAPLPYTEGMEPRSAGAMAVAMVSKNTEHPEEAVRFLSYLASEEAGEIMAGHGVLPAWQSDITTEAFVERLDQPENAGVFFERPINSQVPVDDPLYTEGMKIMEEEVSLYLLQEKELDETFNTIQERIDSEVLNK
ncbi:ABC transporter substrate-binding protein [Saliterribacillus persicus]|uniref:Carbohydrate ABC transporter substrate-binding protein (CUT1 family) n=1 Tax=Saliterribacillus persicus TaxID=930114 RepID=A0A368YB40_9BACI|nr:sugar ABC transporter substrate-binding protein [Saliterribacillus persicus]RCW77345.1 carbohydrate ABC transporter substrate-binding protein (CUT1 family) [Saliterribacillus persicus]